MRRILIALTICSLSQPLFAYRGASELINIPSAKMQKAGEIEYGGGLNFYVKNDITLQNSGLMFFHAALSDKFEYGLTVRDDLSALHSFQGQLYSSFDYKKQIGHYVAAGVKNVGYTTPKVKTTDPVLDYFVCYTMDIPDMGTRYHTGMAYDRSGTRQLVVLAGAEYDFFFGKTMLEWDGRAVNVGIKYRIASNEYFYITVTPTPVSSKTRSPQYVSIAYTLTDNIWENFKKLAVTRPEFEQHVASTDTRLSVVEAKQKALADLLSTEFLSKIETSFLSDTENQKFFNKESKSVVKAAIARMQKGMEYYYQGQFKAACDEYETVVSLLPEYYLGYVRLGSIQYQLGDKVQARRYWEKALTYKIDNPSLKSYLERMLQGLPAAPPEVKAETVVPAATLLSTPVVSTPSAASVTPALPVPASGTPDVVTPVPASNNQTSVPDIKGENYEIKR